jgi:hypothetical protein
MSIETQTNDDPRNFKKRAKFLLFNQSKLETATLVELWGVAAQMTDVFSDRPFGKRPKGASKMRVAEVRTWLEDQFDQAYRFEEKRKKNWEEVDRNEEITQALGMPDYDTLEWNYGGNYQLGEGTKLVQLALGMLLNNFANLTDLAENSVIARRQFDRYMVFREHYGTKVAGHTITQEMVDSELKDLGKAMSCLRPEHIQTTLTLGWRFRRIALEFLKKEGWGVTQPEKENTTEATSA